MKEGRDEDFASAFAKDARRRLLRKLAPRRSLGWIGALGIVGWSVTLPMLAGLGLGLWIDGRFESGYSFSLMLMAGGLFAGCAVAWGWVRRRSRDENRPGADDERRS